LFVTKVTDPCYNHFPQDVNPGRKSQALNSIPPPSAHLDSRLSPGWRLVKSIKKPETR
jgi:hypothetical protein